MDQHGTTESERRNIAKAAGVVGAATLLSRIAGFLRDMIVAGLFGAGIKTDAFFVAFRIPNLLRRLLGEGSLTVSFVPVFAEYVKKRSWEEAGELANVTCTVLSILLVIVTATGIILSPFIVAVIAPGFTDHPSQYELAVFLNRLMFPYIFFISLVALCMGILNALRHFAAPALAPVVLNLSMIASAVTLQGMFREPIVALAVGVLAGGVLQLGMQWPFLYRMGIRLRPDFRFSHPGLKSIGKLLFPSLLGSAVYQINVFIGTILASLLPQGSVSYLYYADRVVELPLGIFAIAVGTASLPSFSDQVTAGQVQQLKHSISFSLRLIFFVTLPATVALIFLRVPIISVLFQRGAFDSVSTLLTAEALLYYSLGLWAFSSIRVIDSAFFSIRDRKSPMKVACLALAVNVGFSIVLMRSMLHGGLALATSLASAANVGVLALILRRKIGGFLDRDFFHSLQGTTIASGVMGVVLMGVRFLMPWASDGPFPVRMAFLLASTAAGLGTFLLSAHVLRIGEMMMLARALQTLLWRRRPTVREKEH